MLEQPELSVSQLLKAHEVGARLKSNAVLHGHHAEVAIEEVAHHQRARLVLDDYLAGVEQSALNGELAMKFAIGRSLPRKSTLTSA